MGLTHLPAGILWVGLSWRWPSSLPWKCCFDFPFQDWSTCFPSCWSVGSWELSTELALCWRNHLTQGHCLLWGEPASSDCSMKEDGNEVLNPSPQFPSSLKGQLRALLSSTEAFVSTPCSLISLCYQSCCFLFLRVLIPEAHSPNKPPACKTLFQSRPPRADLWQPLI